MTGRRLPWQRVASEKESGDDDNNNDNDNDREETPLAGRAAVAKVIVRSLSEGEAEARPEAGPGNDRWVPSLA